MGLVGGRGGGEGYNGDKVCGEDKGRRQQGGMGVK